MTTLCATPQTGRPIRAVPFSASHYTSADRIYGFDCTIIILWPSQLVQDITTSHEQRAWCWYVTLIPVTANPYLLHVQGWSWISVIATYDKQISKCCREIDENVPMKKCSAWLFRFVGHVTKPLQELRKVTHHAVGGRTLHAPGPLFTKR